MKKLTTFLLGTMAFVSAAAQAEDRPLAFPGADGYGRYVTGGRGGEVCYVTRLDDCSDTDLVEGTLRWALRHDNGGRPRTVLFATAGTIYLHSKLKLQYGDVSILGQSAPGGGITITGYNMYLCRNNVIVRYLRFRAGDIPNTSMTGLDLENADRVIIDHCSMTWSMEECLTAYDTDSTTVQWCIIGEGLYNSKNSKGARAYATQWGGEHSTMHHSLITHSHNRAPRFNGVRSSSRNKGDHDYQVDSEFANNVVFNWSQSGNQYGGEYDKTGVEIYDWCAADPGYDRVYLMHNYYRPGPSTQIGTANGRYWCAPSAPYGQWYLTGNKFEVGGQYAPSTAIWSAEELAKVNADNYYGAQSGNASRGINLTGTSFTNYVMTELPYALSGMEYESAEAAYERVTTLAGASLPRYDEVDARLLGEAAGTIAPRFKGSLGELGIIDGPDDICLENPGTYVVAGQVYRNMPEMLLPTDRYAIDSDADGMPDLYEDAVGLNKNDAADGAAMAANGYTHLENYLNGIADGTIDKTQYETSQKRVIPGQEVVAQPSVTVSFSANAVQGTVPATIVAEAGAVTLPANTTLYREGYTLTAWSSEGRYYLPGETYYIYEDLALTPCFMANPLSLDDRTADVTLSWDFDSPWAPSSLAGQGIYVNQSLLGGMMCDFRLSYDAGVLTLPSCKGAVITVNGNDSYLVESTDATYQLQAPSELHTLSVMLPFEREIPASGNVSVTWPWEGRQSDAVMDPVGYFPSATATLGANLTEGSNKCYNQSFVTVKPSAKVSAPTAGHDITFTLYPGDNDRFAPDSLNFLTARFGTDGGKWQVAWQRGESDEQILDAALVPARNNSGAYTSAHYVLNGEANNLPLSVRFYLYNLDATKYVGLAKIKVSGHLESSDGIDQISVRPLFGNTYNLHGQKLLAPSSPGMYIIDGRKVVIR